MVDSARRDEFRGGGYMMIILKICINFGQNIWDTIKLFD